MSFLAHFLCLKMNDNNTFYDNLRSLNMNNSPNINSGWNRDGRFNRMSFIGWNTFYGLMLALVMLIIAIMMPNTMNALMVNAENPMLQGLALGFNILLLIPVIIFSVRRLHDFNISGWLALLQLIPLLNIMIFIVLMLIPGTATANQYGEPRESKTWEVVLAFLFLGLFLLILVNLLLTLKYLF